MGVTDLGFGRYCPRLNVLRRLGSATRKAGFRASLPPFLFHAEACERRQAVAKRYTIPAFPLLSQLPLLRGRMKPETWSPGSFVVEVSR